MNKSIKAQLLKEFSLEMINCVLVELARVQDFDRLMVLRHAHNFLDRECKAETATLLTDESNKAQYTAMKEKLDALVPAIKEQIINILDIENTTVLLEKE